MGILQNEFEQIVAKELSQENIKKSVLRRAAKRHDVELSDDQLSTLLATLTAAINNKENHSCELLIVDSSGKQIELSEDDLKAALTDFEAAMGKAGVESVKTVIDKMPTGILESLYSDAPKMLRDRKRQEGKFERRLYERWHEGLDRLKMLIVIAQEGGDSYRKDFIASQNKAARNSPVVTYQHADALTGLHVRACRIASEVFCLLKSGFADGAHARWRSLHEVAVTALFLSQHKGDSADRYLKHSVIEKWKASQQFQKHCRRLKYQPLTKREMRKSQEDYDRAIGEFGKEFATEYGWASKALRLKRPTFTDVERSLRLDHWRPHFKMACQSIHAGSQGLLSCMGMPSGAMLAGASNYGLTDPGHCTAISLTLTTTVLLTFKPNLDSLITCRVMKILTGEIGEAFLKARNQLDRDMSQTQD